MRRQFCNQAKRRSIFCLVLCLGGAYPLTANETSNMNVRPLRSDEGQLLKDLSIKMCTEVPTAYRLTLAEAEARTDEQWQQLAAESASSPNMESFVGEFSGEPYG